MAKSNIYSGRQGYESRYNTYKSIKKLTQNIVLNQSLYSFTGPINTGEPFWFYAILPLLSAH